MILCHEIDLRTQAFVNIDFVMADQTGIPLHLSLRRDAGLLVLNQLGPKKWCREIVLKAGLRCALHDLQLEFSRDLLGRLAVTLWLDSDRLGRIDAYPRADPAGPRGLRRGFPALGRIAGVTWPEGLRSMRILWPGTAATPVLTNRLELVWNTADQEAELDLHLNEAPLDFLPLPGAGPEAARSLRTALLPGRIWRDAMAGQARLTARSGGRAVEISVDTPMLLDRISSPEAFWQIRNDPIIRLHMLEHVHHADLWEQVSDPVRDLLGATARRLGSKVLSLPKHPVRPGAETPDPAPARKSPADTCDAFHAGIARDRHADPIWLLDTLIRQNALKPGEVRHLALMLSEWFCLHGDPLDLAQLAARHGVGTWQEDATPWGSVAGLPMLWGQGNWSAIEAVLRNYPRQATHWLVTPALGWVGTALAEKRPDLDGRYLPEARQISLMTALLELIAELSSSYWAQTPCTRLMSGVLDILDGLLLLPDWCADWYLELSLRAYGLRPEFWEQICTRPALAEHPLLAQTGHAFDALQTALASGKGAVLWEAARPFLQRRCAGHEMLRRMVLSPHATSRAFARRPDLASLSPVLTRQEIEETALRWLAFPRSQEARDVIELRPGEPVHIAACNGLRNAAADIARTAFSRAMASLGERVHHCLALRQGIASLPEQDVRGLTRMARALSTEDAGFVGIAALLALAEAASRHDATALAQGWCAALREQMERIGSDRLVLAQAPALALERFAALCRDSELRSKLAPWLRPARDRPINEDPIAAQIRAAANPFADTLVALISCHGNLDTRARDCRAAWGDALARLGIPLITVVGRRADLPTAGRESFDGTLLQLDAPDSYEGLPQKSLALARWVLERTGFSRVLKIDDDCLLDAAAYFSDPTCLTRPYYGRPLHRAPGTMDRAWHMARAQSQRGRLELDKSPEPSIYADGSTAYMLSRPALAALARARTSPRGRALEQVSFMEDKLVGDLLSLEGIAVSGQNYDVAVLRKPAGGLDPLSLYENSFQPFAGAPVKLAHLDTGGGVMDRARKALGSPWPTQMKIWPGMVPAQTGWAKNALDLVSPPDRLEQARAAEVAVVAVMRNECFMLDHFLEHYRGLGVGAFLIVDNGSDDGTLEHLVAQKDVSVFSTDTPYSQSTYGVQWQEALVAQFRTGRWSLLADADELAFWCLPDGNGRVPGNLPQLLAGSDFAGVQAVRMLMLDLYPKGRLSEAQFVRAPFLEADHVDHTPLCRDWQGRGPWSNADTVTSALRHRLMNDRGTPARANLFVAQKYALLKYHPLMRLSAGLHYITGARVATRELAFGHFKYHAAFLAKAEDEVARGQHFNNAEEYRAYLGLRAEARETLYDPARSVPLSLCPTVQALCRSQSASKPKSAGMRSRPSRTRSAMIWANAGAIAKPILNPPLNT